MTKFSVTSLVLLLMTFSFQVLSFVVKYYPEVKCNLPTRITCDSNSAQGQYIFSSRFLCDTLTDGGKWMVIQRRMTHLTHFQRDWKSYRNGFGNPQNCEDYWLGNEFVHVLTTMTHMELRIDMKYRGHYYYAKYTTFRVDSEANKYRLTVGGFSGNVRDDLSKHNGMKFSTPDSDNDIAPHHCAEHYGAGWWYAGCHHTNLNGLFHMNLFGYGVIWHSITGDYSSLSTVEMKIRIYDPWFREKKRQ